MPWQSSGPHPPLMALTGGHVPFTLLLSNLKSNRVACPQQGL